MQLKKENTRCYLTPNEIALEMRCTVRTALRTIKAEMTYIKFGKQLRVRFDEYERWKFHKQHNFRTTPELIAAMAKNMMAKKVLEAKLEQRSK